MHKHNRTTAHPVQPQEPDVPEEESTMNRTRLGVLSAAAILTTSMVQGGMGARAAESTPDATTSPATGSRVGAQLSLTTTRGFLPSRAAAPSANDSPQPGRFNAITDVPGILVGQYTRTDDPYQTGTTVVYAPDGAVNGVSVPGGWPGGVNNSMMDPHKNPQLSDAVFLSGGSWYGLGTFSGVMNWLEDHCKGAQVGPNECDVDPLVSGAIVFDLNSGKSFKARPTARFGYRAIDRARGGPVAEGNVGAGTGTHSQPFKAGVGTASVEYPNGLKVGALIVVNAGTSVNPRDCTFFSRFLELGDEFKGLKTPSKRACRNVFPDPQSDVHGDMSHGHTAIAVVATNAKLSDAQTDQMASRGADGEVIGIDTIHTLYDGDTVYALSTGKWGKECNDTACLEQVYAGATKSLARAIVHAMLNASSTDDSPSYCDTFKRACKHWQGK